MPSHNDYEVQSAGASPQRKKEGDPGEDSAKEEPVKTQIVWKNVMIYIYFHAAALYGIYLCFASAKWTTIVWGNFTIIFIVC